MCRYLVGVDCVDFFPSFNVFIQLSIQRTLYEGVALSSNFIIIMATVTRARAHNLLKLKTTGLRILWRWRWFKYIECLA